LARYAHEFGWKVSVFAGSLDGPVKARDDYLLGTLPEDVHVRRFKPSHQLRPSWNWFPQIDGGFLDALATFYQVRAIFDKDPPTIVMASGPTFHNFVAAYYIARLYRAKLVLDYRDEWTVGTPRFVGLGNNDQAWEKRCLREAAAVFFVTQPILDLYLAAFPELAAAKCRLMLNGWEPDDFVVTASAKLARCAEKKWMISFVGILGPHTLPGDFLDVIEQVIDRRADLKQRLKIRFVGRKCPEAIEQLAKFPYQDVVESIDHVPKSEANCMMRESSVLLLLNNAEMSRTLPLKLFEYLAAGPPILVFGDNEGEILNLLRKLRAGIVVREGDPSAFERAIDTFQSGMDSKLDRTAIDEWLGLHTRKMMAQKMVEVFEEIVR
jgi:glycosyltransferase involved in cell wall biosynthesis